MKAFIIFLSLQNKYYKELQLNFPEYGIFDNEIENISKLATIHDIGKISTPYEVLNKKGKLTKEEMDISKKTS